MSLSGLSDIVVKNLPKLPPNIDVVVGIPRSGMIPAYTIGLLLNLPVVNVDVFAENRFQGHGRTRPIRKRVEAPFDAERILLVDDSVYTGKSMNECVEFLRNSGFKGEIVTCAAIVAPESIGKLDLCFEVMEMPRIFEWNLFHHGAIENACLDFDGVLCVDPPKEVNDDGERYMKFLETAKPLYLPSTRIAHIVSARLEKYRPQCEEWLRKNGVEYGQLHLLDLPSQEERRRTQAHIPHKIEVYRKTDTELFIESDEWQARRIAEAIGRPVLSLETMNLYRGSGIYINNIPEVTVRLRRRVKQKVKRLGRRFINTFKTAFFS
ncbi:phosphoribosyltransferase family protein [Pelagicoccus sp. SDUM812002]|uniref:phosphoribosyltransferase family protein n=1 Tax=Pelagicoccus sp. SDUM812002 TaxID=3041266 RepID=UPI00280F0BE5|nr:phosphoribosyltransferase family protein [Pelagicoccus sp. SDUM812002]MDQ8183999.1 phosphoribosyltransferase family protein [Pelagicoccus sp. SDUM812002]